MTRRLLALAAAVLSLGGQGLAGAQAPAPDTNPDPACGGAAVLAIDAYSPDRTATRAALGAFAAAHGVAPMFGAAPSRVLEGNLPPDHVVATYKFACATAAKAAMRGAPWERLVATLRPSPDQRLTLFIADPGHTEPSPQEGSCNKLAYLVLKGRVSDVQGYLAYLRALGSSGLLHKHGMRREVVMPGREVRLATEGASFGPGEFFEVLRFPCRAQLETFWDSAPYRDLVKLREGTMTADALLFE